MEIQFICTVCYLLFNCCFCLWDGAGRNPGSPGCSQSFAIDSSKCKFSLLGFHGLCYGYMKYSVVTLSYFDKCYMDKKIFVISGEFSVVCMKVKQSLLSYMLGASLSSLLSYISTFFYFVLNSYLSLSLLQDAIKFF